jgi:FMN-dependent NADH-azoreductase
MTKEQLLARGRKAAMLLEDELVQEILAEIEEGYVKAWRSTAPTDTETREKMYLALQVVTQFHQALKVVCDNGKFEVAQLERQKGI